MCLSAGELWRHIDLNAEIRIVLGGEHETADIVG